MMNSNKIEMSFDDLLFQTQRGGLTHSQIESGRRYEQFEQVKEWKSKYGYRFNIYSNDHLINGKKHFHFDNKEKEVFCKIDFDGNILVSSGKSNLQSNIEKELKYFLSISSHKKILDEMWDEKNSSK